jgi:hypothetical protein
MEKRERVNAFNQIFINVLITFPYHVASCQSLVIEYYIVSLIPSIEVFVK